MQRKRLALGSGYNNIYLHESKVSKFSGLGFGNFDVAVTVPMSRRSRVLLPSPSIRENDAIVDASRFLSIAGQESSYLSAT
jgi:hypothetical protein